MERDLLKMPDEELQKLIFEGNDAAFSIIFNRYWKRLYAYALKIYKDEAVCEDIVQEIFISFWKNASSTVILNLEAYLFRAVKYKIANQIRNLKFPHFSILQPGMISGRYEETTVEKIAKYVPFIPKVSVQQVAITQRIEAELQHSIPHTKATLVIKNDDIHYIAEHGKYPENL